MEKRQVSAKEILQDIRDGLSDPELMAKHHLSGTQLRTVFRKLVELNALSWPELDMREAILQKTKYQPPTVTGKTEQAVVESLKLPVSEPPLLTAVRNGQLTEVKKLIGEQADLEVKDTDGLTPLLLAAKEGHKDILELLLNSGANYHAEDAKGKSAVSLAAINDQSEITGLLLRHHIQQKEKKPQEKPQKPSIAAAPSGNLEEVTECATPKKNKSDHEPGPSLDKQTILRIIRTKLLPDTTFLSEETARPAAVELYRLMMRHGITWHDIESDAVEYGQQKEFSFRYRQCRKWWQTLGFDYPEYTPHSQSPLMTEAGQASSPQPLTWWRRAWQVIIMTIVFLFLAAWIFGALHSIIRQWSLPAGRDHDDKPPIWELQRPY